MKRERLSLYGDFWMRFLDWGVRHCPRFTEPVLVLFFATGITILARSQRRTIAANFRVLLGNGNFIDDWIRVFRLFCNFAWNLVESSHVRQGKSELAWDITGHHLFESLQAEPGGVLLLTAHIGNYDIAAPVFSEKLGKKLNAVRRPERTEALQNYMESTRDAMQKESFQIHYNRSESMLGLELAQAIGRKEIVAIQADRVLPGISSSEVAMPTCLWQLPKGPFVLAAATKAPIYPVFMTRTGSRSYHIHFLPQIPYPTSTNALERRQEADKLQAAWAALLWDFLHEHWDQWMCLDPAFQSSGGVSPLA
jgi:phosphatidylinositol dimannoside acyltransferase